MAIMKRKRLSTKETSKAQEVELGSAPDALIQLAERVGVSVKPLDISALVKVLGIALRVIPMDEQKSGYIKMEEGRWVIGVNSLHHPNRQRFTIAHELGHYTLHRDAIGEGLEDTILFRADGYGAPGIEREANVFASELLMPESYFRDVVKNCNGDVKEISSQMKVSALAVSIRAKVLGYTESK